MEQHGDITIVTVRAGQIYKHFKGNVYKVYCIAIHTETEEVEVIYYNIHQPGKYYCRPLEMFTSDVDTEKYPEHAGEKRFTLLKGVVNHKPQKKHRRKKH